MKHSIALKIVAVVLAACGLTVALGSALGVILVAEAGLYSSDYETWHNEFYRERAESLATATAESYAARSMSGFTVEELQSFGWGNSWQTLGNWQNLDTTDWCYTVAENGIVRESNYHTSFDDSPGYSFTLRVEYPKKVGMHDQWQERYSYFGEGETSRMLYIDYAASPEYTVTVWFAPHSIHDYRGISLDLYEMLLQFRYALIASLAAGVVLAAVCLVYLCCAAGKQWAGDVPAPGGLNRLPLDLYGVATAAACFGAGCMAVEIVEEFIYYGTGINWGWFVLGVLLVLAAAVCLVGFIMALAAQGKTRGGYLWNHSLIGWCWGKLWIGIRFCYRMLCKLIGLLPLIWRYLLIGLAMGFFPIWFFYLAAVGRSYWVFFLLISCLCDAAIICYGAYAYGTVLSGARKMAAGELYSKIDTKYLYGSYRDCAENLNALADVAVVAAKNQTRSDRMKTELITNVSHDIKTPLTSIINYIDLLQKADTPEQSTQYLDVLDRQAQGLKKLIEDLMEMSKATTGDMAVEITRVDAVEAVNQALGEFDDKLKAQDLTVVFRQPEQPVPISADGRLTWRVLSNLLGNVVKYALPGTRVYVDMACQEGRVQVSIKNISREELNVSADELTERFVRGDASRNTEGSGLGLNIAKSLMELQKGQLQLLVDGDLFKVTLTFPAA